MLFFWKTKKKNKEREKTHQSSLGKTPSCALHDTVVAEMITELIRFEPEICICNGHKLEFKRESVSVMRDFLLAFPEISLSVMEMNSSGSPNLYLSLET